MASDKLYELAFGYKKTKLWKQLSDDEVFAVKLPDGKTGYASIMGMAGDYNAIGLFVGREGFNSYRIIADTYGTDFKSQLLYQEYILRQECLQCTFQNKANLSREEAAEVQDYTKRNNITLRGPGSYPQFVKYKTGYCPWIIQTKQDEQYIAEALKAAVALSGMLKENSPSGLGIKRLDDSDGTVILLEPAENGYKIGRTKLPEPLPEKYLVPDIFNDINVAKLKNTAKSGVWECELVQYPEPVCDEPDEVPYFPMMFLAVESETGFILPVPPAGHFYEAPDKLLDIIVEAFLMQDICPKVIHARDERSYYFLEGLCKKIKTKIVTIPELPSLDKAEEELMEHLFYDGVEEDMPDIMSLFDEIANLSDEELHSLPDIVVKQLEVLIKKNILPGKLSERFDEVFNFTGNKGITGKNENKVISIRPGMLSYVISVSCYKGCYRHIKISADSTLQALHEAILDAYGFDNDHAHVFFMDNVKWSDREAYYVEWIDGEKLYTNCYTLRQAGLEKGKHFKYLYDFGDCWLFQCKVLHVLEEKTDVPVVVRTKGEPPEQYPGSGG